VDSSHLRQGAGKTNKRSISNSSVSDVLQQGPRVGAQGAMTRSRSRRPRDVGDSDVENKTQLEEMIDDPEDTLRKRARRGT